MCIHCSQGITRPLWNLHLDHRVHYSPPDLRILIDTFTLVYGLCID